MCTDVINTKARQFIWQGFLQCYALIGLTTVYSKYFLLSVYRHSTAIYLDGGILLCYE